MTFFIKLIQGLLIGVGAIAPGVSGGTIAIIFGLYEKITDAISHFYRDTKNKIIFFLPIGIGGVLGVLGFGKLIDFLFTDYAFETTYFFIGLMLGSIPTVYKEATSKGFKKINLIPFVVCAAVTVLFGLLDSQSAESLVQTVDTGIPMLLLYGAIIGFGLIVPGISASFMLMYLGSYETIMAAIGNLDLSICIPVAMGIGLSILLFAKLINWLFSKAYAMTYFAALGFVAGSVIIVFPGVRMNLSGLISTLLLIAGVVGSYFIANLKKD